MPLTIKRTNSTSIAANSVIFDGTSQYLTLPASSNWAMTGNFTVECWVNTNLPSNYSGTILSLGSNSSAYAGLRFQITRASSGATPVSIEVLISISGGSWGLTGATSGLMVNGIWNHIAVVRSGGVVTVYINGVGYNIGTINGTLYAGPYNSIGKLDGYSNPFYYNGYISNLRILNGTALYTASFSAPINPLTAIANTSLLTCNAATIVDSSTNNFTITNNGSATVSSTVPFVALPSNNFQFARRASTLSGRSVQFNGSNQYLSGTGTLVSGATTFTAEAWIYLTSTPLSPFGIISSTDAAATPYGWTVRVNPSSQINFGETWGANGVNSNTILSLNIWYHIAAVRNGSTANIFINGVKDTSTGTFNNSYTSTTFVLGRSYTGTNIEYFPGYISNVRVVSGTALYTASFTAPTTPLTAISGTSLLTCNLPTIADSSNNNFTITNNNGATVSSTSPFVASGGGMSLKKVYADPAVVYLTQKAIFGYGNFSGNLSMTNLVSNTGVVATDTTGVGTARFGLAAAGYGGDKAIFGYGSFYNISNLVSNTGVVATDSTGVGTSRRWPSAAGYGSDKAIFGYGYTGATVSMTNLVSNTGVVATDTTGVGTARWGLAAAGYGTDKAIFGYGNGDSGGTSITNLISNTGVVATDTTGVGTARWSLAAAGYGTDKAIFGYGTALGTEFTTTNLVSNTGVVATDTTGVGTKRQDLAAAGYGTDKAIFGYGYQLSGAGLVSITNKVSNTGVVATDTTGVGTKRQDLAAAGYSLT